jgi:hypothetical protein
VPTVASRILDTRTEPTISTLGPNTSATMSFAGAVRAETRAVEVNITTTGGRGGEVDDPRCVF